MISTTAAWWTTISSRRPPISGTTNGFKLFDQNLALTGGRPFLQQPDGAPWKILVNDTTMFKEVYFDFPEEEFRRMLANSNVILPGEPGFIPPVQA